MNREVYKQLLHTFGRQPLQWVGVFTELVRTILIRVVTIFVLATITANITSGNIEAAKTGILLFITVNVVGILIGAIGDIISVKIENIEYQRVLMEFYSKLTNKDMSFYRDNQTGYLASSFRQYLDGMMALVRLLRTNILRIGVSLTVPAMVLFFADWKLGVLGAGIVVVQVVYIRWSSVKTQYWIKKSHEVYRKVTGEVSDEITNIVAFKSSGVEKEAHRKVARLSKDEANSYYQRRKQTVLLDLPRNILTTLVVALAFYVVLQTASSTAGAAGLAVLTVMYMFQIIRNAQELPGIIVDHDDLVAKIYPTLEYLHDAQHTITDPADPKKLSITKGAIDINHVDFKYEPGVSALKHISVFEDLDLHIAGGEHVGVVGLSGAGKSTLASLLMRFDEVSSGAITIDGIDIRDVAQCELRKKIAYVPQEPLLFHRSVRENIAYFNSSATDKEIIAAAQAAHADEFIATLPNGYNTMVGERGIKLSGGQKQRIVIARAILKGAPIMLFDEATSALDSESEEIIQQSLPAIIGKHTAIVIAHRLSTIAHLDRIIVMHDGKIAEQGSHQELLKLKGRYYSLWQKQTKSHQ